MKIKKVEFCNINSLAGEWSIDFESPEFEKAGMFCIAGPTGSGKTSILDAICLGLYGETPRLDSITGKSNELMTYGTKNCYSKVTFECGGNVYTASWEQHRARGTNTLQSYSWTLNNHTTGKDESFGNQKEIESTMTRVIGLDFDQFTKSMMLAQGEFNKFLKCKQGERAAILEKLTGDVIYRKIAVAVHDLYETCDNEVKNIENRMGDFPLLSEEELADLTARIENAESQRQMLGAKVERLTAICAWYDAFRNLGNLLQGAKDSLSKAKEKKDAFEPKRDKLERALRAQEVESIFAEFDSIRENLEGMKKLLEKNKADLPKAESDLEEAKKVYGECQQSCEKCRAEYATNESVWEQVSSLDVSIGNARTQSKKAKDEIGKIVAESKATQEKIAETDNLISENEKNLEKVEKYIAENKSDETIDGKLSLLKSNISEWKTETATSLSDAKKLDNLKKSLQDFDTKFEKQNQELQSLRDYLESHKVDEGLVSVLPEVNGLAGDAERHRKEVLRLQGEIVSKKTQIENVNSNVEKADAEFVSLQSEKESIIKEDIPVVVAELRRNLKVGEPCPVCGSLEHVSCEEKENIENGANSLNDFANKLRKIDEKIGNVHRLLADLKTQKQGEENLLRDYTQKQADESEAETKSLEQLNAKLGPWNKSVTFDSMRATLQDLLALKDAYLQKKERVEALLENVHQAMLQRTKIESDIGSAEDLLDKSKSKIQEYSEKIEKTFAEWFSNVRMEDADALLAELDKKNDYWKKAQDRKISVEKNLETLRSGKEQRQESLTQIQSRLKEADSRQNELQIELERLEKSRRELFGEKSVDEERGKARTLRNEAENRMNEAHRKEQQMREAKVALDSSIANLQNRVAETEPKFEQLQTLYHEKLASKSFASEQEFKEARLPETERKALQAEQNSVEEHLTTAQTSVNNYGDQLAAHEKKRDFEESEETAKQNCEISKNQLGDCNKNLGTWLERKKSDENFRLQYSELQAQLTKLVKKRDDWAQMQRWFNGKNHKTGNGDEFVKFIQTITLRNLLKISNGFLHDMFPRYEMVAKEGTLDIQLIDHDNSDAIRPVDNISGGEGFLVSLSLALGISTLASRNVSIDSMFLDEGFGTLDSKILQETVLVLQKMQQEKGKLLGIITHVDLVKNELRTHIDVTPRGGRSVLSGAGVKNCSSKL